MLSTSTGHRRDSCVAFGTFLVILGKPSVLSQFIKAAQSPERAVGRGASVVACASANYIAAGNRPPGGGWGGTVPPALFSGRPGRRIPDGVAMVRRARNRERFTIGALERALRRGVTRFFLVT